MHETDDTGHAIPADTTRQGAMNDTPAGGTTDTSGDASTAILQVDAARRAGVSVRTIQRAIDRGHLEATRDGVHCWIRLDHLDRWQVERTTRSATARVVARDNDASPGSTNDASPDMSRDVPGYESPPRERLDAEIERLRGEITDLRVERNRWHQAFERESALREEEMRELRLLLRQEQALSFSRLAAIEATTRHDTPTADAPSPSTISDEPAEASHPPAHDVTSPQDAPAPEPERPVWRRLLGRLGGSR